MRYACGDERRREVIRASGTLNGIDYVEVIDHDAPTAALRQRTLVLRLLRPATTLDAGQVRIDGGERLPSVDVEWVARADALPADEDPSLVEGLTPADHFWLVRTAQWGDRSTYTLRLAAGPVEDLAPAGFDPKLVSVDFSFKVECPSDLDCAICRPTGTLRQPVPEIDYLAKDYQGFRRLMLDRLDLLAPDWRERNAADVGVAVVETLAYVADQLSYRQDAVATEAYLTTARRRTSLRRHVRLVDYRVDDGANALAWVQVSAEADGVEVPRGLQVFTTTPGLPTVVGPGGVQYREAIARRAEVFETVEGTTAFHGHARLEFYTWGARNAVLLAGATEATLTGAWPNLKAGDVLVLMEALGPRTGRAEDADPTRRHAVRLTHVHPAEDPSGGLFLDPPSGDPVPVTEVAWDVADALPFDLCLATQAAPESTEGDLAGVSVALGNIVLGSHGRTIVTEPLGVVPAPYLAWAQADDADCEGEPQMVPARFAPALAEGPVTQERPAATSVVTSVSAAAALVSDLDGHAFSAAVQQVFQAAGVLFTAGPVSVQGTAGSWSVSDSAQAYRLTLEDGRIWVRTIAPAASLAAGAAIERMRPAVTLTAAREERTETWTPQGDLFGSPPDGRHFVVEVEHDGSAAVRFGDDVYGKRPEPGTVFVAHYRVGNGARGNVGRESITHLVTDDGRLTDVWNPMPAFGGRNPEDGEAVRRNAPEAYRTQQRAVTEADYAAVAGLHDDTQRVAATFRWTGSWHTVFLTADRHDGRPVDDRYEAGMRRHVGPYRMAGHDLEVDPPRFVPLEVALEVCVCPDYFRAHVREQLQRALGSGWLADGTPALFHPDRFTFGQPVYLSDIYAAVHAVEGVESAAVRTFQRLHTPDPRPLDEGLLEMGQLEIARLDNNPSSPERGLLRLTVEGGK